MKQINSLLLCICVLPFFSKAQLINNGATIVVSTGTNLVLDNLSLQNNGTFDQTAGRVVFTGSSNGSIGGSITPGFYVLQLNKPAATLQLETGIVLHNQLQFTNGLINLNTHTILLDAAAFLSGESETSRIYGTNGYVQITQSLNSPLLQDPGNLGASITSAQNLGLVTIRRGHRSQTNTTGTGNSILRYYDINPANNTLLNASVRINYFDAELNGLNENNLTVWKSNNNVNWTDLGKSSNNATLNFVEKTGINDMARFTLSSPFNILPLVWNSFNTQCLSGQVRISWKTEQEQNTSRFIVRRSTDGRNWTTIGELKAGGNSNSPLSYSYTDPQSLPGTSYYQIQQQDFDGRSTISPVLSNNCGMTDDLNVYPNPVLNNCWVNIQLTRGGALSLQLYDSKGSLVQQRRESVQNGNNQFELRMQHFAKGVYSLVITRPDGIIKVVKIEKY